MDRSKTIIDVKAAFLRHQVRLLSAPLQPSTQWRDFAPETEEDDLNDKTIKDVMVKVNDKIKQHNRMVYSAQSQRHVAEQIDTLYWNSVKKNERTATATDLALSKDSDLTTTEAAQSLPAEYTDLQLHASASASASTNAEDAQKYAELRRRLLDASVRRDRQRRRLEQYRRLQTLLGPFEDAQANVQPNLVTKDGELSRELDRMRVLVAKVAGRMAEMGDVDGADNGEEEGRRRMMMMVEGGMSDQQRLAAAMDLT